LYLGCARSARLLPRGFTGHVARSTRSILWPSYFSKLFNSYFFLLTFFGNAQRTAIAPQRVDLIRACSQFSIRNFSTAISFFRE
jgi:hypothetical protein